MNTMKKTISALLLNTRIMAAIALLVLGVFAYMAPVSAQAPSQCDNLPGSERGACLADPDAYASDGDGSDVLGLVSDVINIISLVVGIIAVIMIIIGGLKYIMSAGDPSNITAAKNTILYAIIGLVIVAFAQMIVLFVLTETTDEDSSSGGSDVETSKIIKIEREA